MGGDANLRRNDHFQANNFGDTPPVIQGMNWASSSPRRADSSPDGQLR